jgi:hypothetical protein
VSRPTLTQVGTPFTIAKTFPSSAIASKEGRWIFSSVIWSFTVSRAKISSPADAPFGKMVMITGIFTAGLVPSAAKVI